MEYTRLGRSGLRVSRLCLGTMNFGAQTQEKEAQAIMDCALDAGITLFDTADAYGPGSNTGESERILGRWFALGGGRRTKTILASKVYDTMDSDFAEEGPNAEAGLSLYKVRRHLEKSLQRLQTDHLELYYMHHIDRSATWPELWEAFEGVVRAGKVDYVGSSNFAGWDLATAQAAAEKRHFLGLVCEQHRYNLDCRLPELEVLPAAKANGIGILPWSPLQGGLLGRNALDKAHGGRAARIAENIEKARPKLEQFDAFAKELGYPQDQIALAWLLHSDAVTSVIVGPRTRAQLEDSLKCLEIHLGEQEMKRLDEIFPGPGGMAPWAYAW
ncbi:MAG: aldo/keto reductase [Gemmiger sp.]|nr:aldo/keto reductase [Gemmiger sp.]